MKPEVVLALYRPHPGKDADLQRLIARHLPVLRRLELVTDRPGWLMRAQDGTYIEVFEWRTAESARLAHEHPEVAKVWEAMGEIADFPALESLAEAKERFSHFEPVAL
jgi:hypothetical protein